MYTSGLVYFPNHILLGTSGGQIFASQDGGNSRAQTLHEVRRTATQRPLDGLGRCWGDGYAS